MFPLVEKTYRVRVTEDIERDLRFLGQSRVDALTSNFDMTLVKDKGNLQLYELAEKEFFTMKGVTTVNAPLDDVMALLRMDSTATLRDVMGEVFGTLFLDGVVLHRAKDTRKHESLSVNWTALQSSKPHLPHRDYVFLRYGDVFEKPAEHGNSYHSNGSGLYVGASIWESIELDGCDPLPASQNVVRLRMRRCGIVVEETNSEAGLRISFFLSEAHPGRAAVSTITRGWMTKLVSCTPEIGNVIVARALASQSLLSKDQFIKDGVNCFICIKGFTMFRRKHHCRVCGDVVCSKCSEVKNLKQSGVSREIRVCQQCRSSSTTSIRSSDSDSRTVRPGGGSSKPSFSNYSIASSSDPSQSYDEDTSTYTGSTSSNAQMIPEHNSLSDSNSESARVKTYPAPRSNSRGVGPEQPRLLTKKPSMTSSDMILLSKQEAQLSGNDMILLSNKQHSNRGGGLENSASGYSEFGIYSTENGLSPEEMAEMELRSTVHENTPFKYALSYSSRQDWPKAPVPMNEVARLKKVRELHLADPGYHFQEMCEYAAAEMGCQIAGVCFIGDKTGFLMAKVGLEKRELSRNVLFDAHAIMSDEPTIILDASEDVRFVNNPLVQDGQVRFYAGFPMITSDGHTVGSFCVADPFARESLSGDKFFFLKNLADVAIRGVEQNTINQMAGVGPTSNSTELGAYHQVPPPPSSTSAMNIVEAHQTMQELLKTAYSTQVQVRMQVNPLTK